MILFVLIGVLALVVAGCVCVVWASRGGPRWVRAVAAVTLLGGEVARAGRRRPGAGRGDDTSGTDAGSDG
ncbi:hypothetical protein [Streptomyces sp. SS]|uniref:hypothetical protein n=1 Tax=Streptomyces sp. SS TaxID=260742 RepID=UPI0002D5531D|nr:hypothetical protein [Streptomyces sp. SS]